MLSSYDVPETPALTHLTVTVVAASTTQRSVLDEHVPPDADQVLVLCYSDHLDAEAADATTLITLLHVRDILARSDSSTPVVSEMIDDRNRALAQVADIDDVVVSGEIVSLIVAQALRGRPDRAGARGPARLRRQRDLPAPRRVVRRTGPRDHLGHRRRLGLAARRDGHRLLLPGARRAGLAGGRRGEPGQERAAVRGAGRPGGRARRSLSAWPVGGDGDDTVLGSLSDNPRH
ncbi:hypothetical protein G5V59_08825 [Nocardioides sp. W3-2-3]|uniref:hypothetical protein n=1 Tax=Nocardioides convexus TaxID=2712224 RepID=UPI00241819A4|nr:hypothetical protein [Nocardioides convexus]NHA00195.1 hypothetical protein [Nocardioides convexus]